MEKGNRERIIVSVGIGILFVILMFNLAVAEQNVTAPTDYFSKSCDELRQIVNDSLNGMWTITGNQFTQIVLQIMQLKGCKV